MNSVQALRSDATRANLSVDFGKDAGRPIRPLHGVNSGPRNVSFVYDARPQFVEAGFPYVRLHDIEYPFGAGNYVDIPCIFKNFDADENDPDSYNFALTDEYIRQTLSVSAKVVYRLGVSIEHAPAKLYTLPPKDFSKWARICEHVIRHYNEGWADGYEWGIEYWEIWNESDADSTKTWAGSQESFIEFYTVSARHLKAQFPHLKIGGCGFTGSHPDNVAQFLRAISEKSPRVPLDFFSFHCYSCTPDKPIRIWENFRALLRETGYGNTEMALNEWNFMGGWDRINQPIYYRAMKDHRGACYYAAMLAAFQTKTDLEAANYFEATPVKEFCGIFDVREMRVSIRDGASVQPTKGFYAFKAFNALYRMGTEVEVGSDHPTLEAVAATGACGDGILIANQGLLPTSLALTVKNAHGDMVVRLTDPIRTNEIIRTVKKGEETLSLTIPADGFLYVGTDLPDPVPTYDPHDFDHVSVTPQKENSDAFFN